MPDAQLKIQASALTSPEFIALSDAAFVAWFRAASWCLENETPFVVSLKALQDLDCKPRAVSELVEAGLWRSSGADWECVGSWHWGAIRSRRRERIPEAMRQAVIDRDGPFCQFCGDDSDLQMDHVFPWSLGGATTIGNLQPLCGTCNKRKGARLDVMVQGG